MHIDDKLLVLNSKKLKPLPDVRLVQSRSRRLVNFAVIVVALGLQRPKSRQAAAT